MKTDASPEAPRRKFGSGFEGRGARLREGGPDGLQPDEVRRGGQRLRCGSDARRGAEEGRQDERMSGGAELAQRTAVVAMPRPVGGRSRTVGVVGLNAENRDVAECGLQFTGDFRGSARDHPVGRRREQLRDDRQCRQADGERRANPRPGALRPAGSFRLRCALASQPKAPSHGVALPLYHKKVRCDGCQSFGAGDGTFGLFDWLATTVNATFGSRRF
jgi:hypothetical protein